MATFNQRNITEFRSRLAGGGARANLFEVEIAFPEELGINLTDISDKVPFQLKQLRFQHQTWVIFLFHTEVVFFLLLEIVPLILGQ